ncbi:hypothetical protein BDV36DRAFT_15709 [Aspergillus pseudocaelatus]|uniref:Uncharacterized protein n=1 Tax=Aspergillus pseudocaelatus TaxID=1825620 RepID=A0ABQ6WD32_9EURO|nr:hypothetical protein BDV36DRAFT_15709 [Aspergillus pseudocaelatus]
MHRPLLLLNTTIWSLDHLPTLGHEVSMSEGSPRRHQFDLYGSNPGVFSGLSCSEVLLTTARSDLWSTVAIHVITMVPSGSLSRFYIAWFLMHNSPAWPGG